MILTKKIDQHIVHYYVPQSDSFVAGTYIKGFQIQMEKDEQGSEPNIDEVILSLEEGAFLEDVIVGPVNVMFIYRLKEIANIPFTEAYEAMLELYGEWIVKKLENYTLSKIIKIQVDIDHLYNMPRNISQFRDFVLNSK